VWTGLKIHDYVYEAIDTELCKNWLQSASTSHFYSFIAVVVYKASTVVRVQNTNKHTQQ